MKYARREERRRSGRRKDVESARTYMGMERRREERRGKVNHVPKIPFITKKPGA